MQHDDDNPEWTAEDFARAKRAEELPDAIIDAFPKTRARIGRPPNPDKKEVVSIRLDRDLVARLRATGEGWQTRANELLRQAVFGA